MNLINNIKKFKPVRVASITLSNTHDITIKKAFISQINIKGFNLIFNRYDLVPSSLKLQLYLYSLCNKNIQVYIPEMEMEMEGTIKNTQSLKERKCKIYVEFFPEVPRYWRECVFDLWPKSI